MSTKKYVIEETECKKTDCNLKFNVIISPIYAVVTTPVAEIKLNEFSSGKKIVNSGVIDNYIVAKCHCGHFQRVYLKIN